VPAATTHPAPALTPAAPPAAARAAVARGLRVRFGRLWVDALTFAEGLAEIDALVRLGRGGSVFTPNVDHVVLADRDRSFRRAYRSASLSFADGTPVLWASRLLGERLPAKLSGSDMVVPIAELAARRGWRVYLLGGAPGVAAEAADRLRALCGVNVVGVDDAVIRLDGAGADDAEVIARIRRARPELLLVALGAPKQELWIARTVPKLGATVAVGVGATLDFIAGRVRRAPAWMSAAGLEWLYRLAQEPRRRWRRYLVQDPAFVLIVLRTLRLRRAQRRRVVARWQDQLPASAPP
jgi:N-acetylglucosaminyldiphosphoundecaprenol N-acetyl-beta-D-mannosaminyltransferase